MTALARTIIKLCYQKRLYIDDAFLLLAVSSLCAAVGVVFISFPSMHRLEGLVNEIISPQLSSNDYEKAQYRKIQHVFTVLYLTTIFAVKFSFLFVFRNLIGRLRTITLYWRVVSVITALAWVFGVSILFIPCHNCDGNSKLSQIRRHGYPSIVPDTVTNLLSAYSLINPLPILIISLKLTLSFCSRGHSRILDTSNSN